MGRGLEDPFYSDIAVLQSIRASAAIVEGQLVKISSGGWTPLATSDEPSVALGVALTPAEKSGSQVAVAVDVGQHVLLISDGAGSIALGDGLTRSTLSAGRVAVATEGIVARALEGCPATAGTPFKAIWYGAGAGGPGVVLATAAPSSIEPDDAAVVGTSTRAAREDHQHAIVAATPGSILPDDVANEGTASSFARSDHVHAIAAAAPTTILPDDSALEGSASSFARSDHVHAIVAAAPGTIQPDDTAAEGSATSFARSDHRHAIVTDTAVATGAANAEGSATGFSRSDHVHQTKIDVTAVEGNSAITTQSTTPVVATGMTITPGAGNWLVLVSVRVSISIAGTITLQVFQNGNAIDNSLRSVGIATAADTAEVTIITLVTGLSGGQAIDLRWSQSSGVPTSTMTGRCIAVIRAV